MISILINLYLLAIPGQAIKADTTIAESWNQMFLTKSGWIGGDAVYSVPVQNQKILWLFGDSIYGKVVDGQRKDSVMIRNAIALSSQNPAFGDAVFPERIKEGKITGFFQAAGDGSYLWPLGNWTDQGSTHIFFAKMVDTKGGGVFGFEQKELLLATIQDNSGNPLDWKILYQKVPFFQRNQSGEVNFGSSVLAEGEWIYVYGYKDLAKPTFGSRSMVVARVPRHSFGDYSKWEFHGLDGWKNNISDVKEQFRGVATEYSVIYLKNRKSYLATYTENGLGENILGRMAKSPAGPWSEPFVIYRCPESSKDKKLFTYSSKAHGWYGDGKQVLVSYCVNSWDFGRLFQDQAVYRPMFLLATIPENIPQVSDVHAHPDR